MAAITHFVFDAHYQHPSLYVQASAYHCTNCCSCMTLSTLREQTHDTTAHFHIRWQRSAGRCQRHVLPRAKHVFCYAGEENGTRCATQSGARVVALTTHRSAQPYEFPYDHVAGELSTQDDMFMCKLPICFLLKIRVFMLYLPTQLYGLTLHL